MKRSIEDVKEFQDAAKMVCGEMSVNFYEGVPKK